MRYRMVIVKNEIQFMKNDRNKLNFAVINLKT